MSVPYSESSKKDQNITVQGSLSNLPEANNLNMKDKSFYTYDLGKDVSFCKFYFLDFYSESYQQQRSTYNYKSCESNSEGEFNK